MPQTNLVLSPDAAKFTSNGLEFGPFVLTDCGITKKGNVTTDDLISLGVLLLDMRRGEFWWLGDLVEHAQKLTSIDPVNVIARVSGDPVKAERAARMARMFPPDRRKPKLSFQHHVEVSTLPADLQDEILEQAEKQMLSLRKTRQLVRDALRRKDANNHHGTEQGHVPYPANENRGPT